MSGIVNFVLFLILWLYGLDLSLKWQLLHYHISDLETKIAYTSRFKYMKNYITSVTKYNQVDYSTNEKVWDVTSGDRANITWLVINFNFTDQNTWYMFIPDKNCNKKYIYSGNSTKLESIDKFFITISKSPIGSYYYSWNNNTGDIYNWITDKKICHFNSVTKDCK